MSKRIHFIGGGQMVEAIIRPLLKSQKFQPNQITVADIQETRNQYLETTYQISAQKTQEQSLETADLIVIGVRPQDDLPTVIASLKKSRPGVTILSIVAGVTIEQIEQSLGEPRAIVRVIPNTLTDTGLGYSGVALNALAKKRDVDFFLTGFGKVMYVEEKLIDVFTGFGVAGPNYVYYFIESYADAGVLAGLSREQARAIALENTIGAVAMLQQTGKHPRELLDINNSAGGVGIHALFELNQSDFAAGLQRSVLRAVKRTTELGQESK
ncbi:pyrroline-5-carboxylate reductase family protein [Enterococcus lemanii]|uniref:Pyrroline-5-carboxylate reductase n=1 Tax=Enterococcus lemanii TaxID=1159752 RepID=A0ABV9MTP0_9ENTE|nr:pyrroline-5-carboxylate reductase [Enterococcus lemanii]MBM7710020.1 pyrroline-5-carboxylate reductase [Enterococcus lemanii]